MGTEFQKLLPPIRGTIQYVVWRLGILISAYAQMNRDDGGLSAKSLFDLVVMEACLILILLIWILTKTQDWSVEMMVHKQ